MPPLVCCSHTIERNATTEPRYNTFCCPNNTVFDSFFCTCASSRLSGYSHHRRGCYFIPSCIIYSISSATRFSCIQKCVPSHGGLLNALLLARQTLLPLQYKCVFKKVMLLQILLPQEYPRENRWSTLGVQVRTERPRVADLEGSGSLDWYINVC